MPHFTYRSYEKELLDEPGIPFAEIKQNMKELNVINSLLGGHRITLKGVKRLMHKSPSEGQLSIVEIGCGGGDNLRVIRKWCGQYEIDVSLTGIDINKECIAFAEAHPANKNMRFICSDYKEVIFEKKPHIIFSSLFCHHFTNDELCYMLGWLQRSASIGFFVNDLHRHPLAFYSIKLLTHLFSKSRLVKNDAPLSVLRGFSREDWQTILAQAGVQNYSVHWHWAFRWLVTAPA